MQTNRAQGSALLQTFAVAGRRLPSTNPGKEDTALAMGMWGVNLPLGELLCIIRVRMVAVVLSVPIANSPDPQITSISTIKNDTCQKT